MLKTNYSPLPQGQGCNLYPDSGCDSIGGLLHFKCSRTSECFNSEQEAKKCEAGEDVSSGGCQRDEFKCFGGRCIPMHQVCWSKAVSVSKPHTKHISQQVCDGTPHCKESNDSSSDEGLEPKQGCNLFNDTSANPPCQSLYGFNFSR